MAVIVRAVNAARSSTYVSPVDPSWETIDPNPDIHALFLTFNDTYFWGTLSGCEVRWSPRMTLCAGLCVYEGRGGLCSIRLSQPLLKFRPRKDLVETLLHEMIHAYLFVSERNTDHDGHGPQFQQHMHRINKACGSNITIYHSFHAEVDIHRQHWWRCQGPCRERKPYYGYVKRSCNRPPGPHDLWHEEHKRTCGGEFIKVKEPDGYKQKKRSANEAKSENVKRGKEDTDANAGDKVEPNSPTKFPGTGVKLGGSVTDGNRRIDEYFCSPSCSQSTSSHPSPTVELLPCPVCNVHFPMDAINAHLDSCLDTSSSVN